MGVAVEGRAATAVQIGQAVAAFELVLLEGEELGDERPVGLADLGIGQHPGLRPFVPCSGHHRGKK
ncbi:hypothetical protein COU60_04795 [Candidatus Pacearchaeota archaeon CG10_big_fil_rev_8_21_14_0_10_34_76]|nr:MAG: hypothetical protein COU60_04795 [Candidatus Pacearchaeota archaeon CG10_big_fil_rev_8_21_14_0_10_34_76]